MLTKIPKGILSEGEDHLYWDPFPRFLPAHGWKIHVSCFHHNADRILARVSEYCWAKEISFKVVKSRNKLKYLLSKNASRCEAGKFITLYPLHEEEFIDILRGLYPYLKGEEGPYILSDRRYLTCRVLYYRYGVIQGKSERMIFRDGTVSWDKRLPYFDKPAQVKDPFPDGEIVAEAPSPLAAYSSLEAIQFNGGGGVYLGVRAGKKCVLKEARPYIGIHLKNTSILCRQREAKWYQKFTESPYTPNLLREFQAWEHYYIEVEFVPGESMRQYAKTQALCLFNEEDKKNQQRLCQVRFLMKKLLLAMESFHAKGLVVNDISLDNIIITPEGQPVFIDLEDMYAVKNDEKFCFKLRNPRLSDDRWENLTAEQQDIHQLGYLFMALLSNAPTLLAQDPSGEKSQRQFFEFCAAYQVPRGIYLTIIRMLSGKYASVAELNRELAVDGNLSEQKNPQPERHISVQVEEMRPITFPFGLLLKLSSSFKREVKFKNGQLQRLQSLVKKEKLKALNRFLIEEISLSAESSLMYGQLLPLLIYFYLYQELGIKSYLELFTQGLKHYRKCYVNKEGMIIENHEKAVPYMTHTGSLVKLQLHYYAITKSIALRKHLVALLKQLDRNFPPQMGYANGLLGLADLFFDAYLLLGNSSYFQTACKKLDLARAYLDPNVKSFEYGVGALPYLQEKLLYCEELMARQAKRKQEYAKVLRQKWPLTRTIL